MKMHWYCVHQVLKCLYRIRHFHLHIENEIKKNVDKYEKEITLFPLKNIK